MIDERELEAVYTLWNELSDFPLADIDGAHRHLMETLAGWIAADNVVWVGGVRVQSGAEGKRDAQHGWRGRTVKLLHAPPARARKSAAAAREQDTEPALPVVALTANAGKFRVQRLRDGFIDFDLFRQTRHYKVYYQDLGLVDRIWVVVPVNRDAESYFLFDLHATRRRFSAADASLVGHALRGLKWFHRQLLLSHGLPLAEAPFTAGQRRVLAQLLTNAKEAEVARKLQLSRGTVHQYAVELYRKLGVTSRAGLMALWLSG